MSSLYGSEVSRVDKINNTVCLTVFFTGIYGICAYIFNFLETIPFLLWIPVGFCVLVDIILVGILILSILEIITWSIIDG